MNLFTLSRNIRRKNLAFPLVCLALVFFFIPCSAVKQKVVNSTITPVCYRQLSPREFSHFFMNVCFQRFLSKQVLLSHLLQAISHQRDSQLRDDNCASVDGVFGSKLNFKKAK